MKHGKLILGAAAFLVTAAGALAFKTANKYSTHKLYGTKASGACFHVTCWTAVNNGIAIDGCHLTTSNHNTATNLYTQRTAGTGQTCKTKYTGLITHTAQ